MNRPIFMQTSSRQSHHRCVKISSALQASLELRQYIAGCQLVKNGIGLHNKARQSKAYQPAKLSWGLRNNKIYTRLFDAFINLRLWPIPRVPG
jgi:hypothetical protein